MHRSLTLQPPLLDLLELAALREGFSNLEQFLESVASRRSRRADRSRAVAEIDRLRTDLARRVGTLGESAQLIREDRDR